MISEEKDDHLEILDSLSVSLKGKVGDSVVRVDEHGNQHIYPASHPIYYSRREQREMRHRFRHYTRRINQLKKNDRESWQRRIKGKKTTFQAYFLQLASRAYFENCASFNLIKEVRLEDIRPEKAHFTFNFDVPGRFTVIFWKEGELLGIKRQIYDDNICDDGGYFFLDGLEPGQKYNLMIKQPLVQARCFEERKLDGVGNQVLPTHIKGESGHYAFSNPPAGGAAARLNELLSRQQ